MCIMWWGDTRTAGKILKTTEDGTKFFLFGAPLKYWIIEHLTFSTERKSKILLELFLFFSDVKSLWRYRLFNFGSCASCVGEFFPIDFISLEASRHNEKSAEYPNKIETTNQRTKEPRVNYENRNRKTFHPKHPKTRTQWEREAKREKIIIAEITSTMCEHTQ